MKSKRSVPSEEEEESTELTRFRKEWLAELRKRRGSQAGNDAASLQSTDLENTPSSSTGKGKVPAVGIPENILPGPSNETISGVPSAFATVTQASLNAPPKALHPNLASALNIYRQAVEHETRGELDDAMVLYRQAFRMDANVDKAYMREEMISSILVSYKKERGHRVDKSIEDVNDEFTSKMQKSLHISTSDHLDPRGLATIVQTFPDDLKFEPEEEGERVLIDFLPDEILVMVLLLLDPMYLERFARTSRKARLLTLEPAIWRRFVVEIYRPPQVNDLEELEAIVKRSLCDYRRVFIEQPRIRYDGVYIATCHYVRPGLSENSWVNVSHLITYHRFLRFLPDGRVLSLLANEEVSPQDVIPTLKPSLRQQGMSIGRWILEGTTIRLLNLLDANGKFYIPSSGALDDMSSSAYGHMIAHMRYTFQMTLELTSKPLGRWNKLTMKRYESVNLGNGDVCPVSLKHERPFWFSKVRSWSLY